MAHIGRRAVVAAALACGVSVRGLAQCPDGTPPPCASRPTRAVASGPAPTSIAVLYFENLSADTADAYLADGLTEEIIARLGQLDRLQVKPRSSVRRFRAFDADPVAVARQLNVAHLVTGSVRRGRAASG